MKKLFVGLLYFTYKSTKSLTWAIMLSATPKLIFVKNSLQVVAALNLVEFFPRHIIIKTFLAFSVLQCALDVRTRLSSLELQDLKATFYKDEPSWLFISAGNVLILVFFLKATNIQYASTDDVLPKVTIDLLHFISIYSSVHSATVFPNLT